MFYVLRLSRCLWRSLIGNGLWCRLEETRLAVRQTSFRGSHIVARRALLANLHHFGYSGGVGGEDWCSLIGNGLWCRLAET